MDVKRIKYFNVTNLLAIVLLFTGLEVKAIEFVLPQNGDNVVGSIHQAYARRGETLFEIGRRYDIGYFEMVEANPNINPEQRLSRNTRVVIPSRFILPGKTRTGIVINLAELRLYYFYPDGKRVLTEPVGIGRVGWKTPTGVTKIIQKKKNPTWTPPQTVRAEAETQGITLPDVWPAGPDNPLGQYMLRMGWHSYLIHGTSAPEGVGKRVSAGCIRMFPEDIESLFYLIDVGTKVTVVDQPIKVGWQGHKFLVEVHQPLEEKGELVDSDTIKMVNTMTNLVKNKPIHLRWRDVSAALKRQSGLPVVVGRINQNQV